MITNKQEKPRHRRNMQKQTERPKIHQSRLVQLPVDNSHRSKGGSSSRKHVAPVCYHQETDRKV